MSSQKDNSVLFVFFKHVPEYATSRQVETRSWFIKQYEFWLSTHCNCNRKFTLVTTR
jgi:hypothetical protein